ncbi:peptidoglycan DD-metalloendopeptidase family protein [Aquimonas sp.]|uniref:peptidoglycan DD-metalloendopeptidase family protein n=1 Tax=Aquimonas sp. TaxID=1872588 RepID=UPI0037BE701B
MNRPLRALALLLVVLTTACGVAPRAVVVDRSPPPTSRPGSPIPDGARTHTVQRGDTLYGIAFRHGLDFRRVAGWNGIGPPYTIYPGQRIRLQPQGAGTAVATRPAGGSPAAGNRPPGGAIGTAPPVRPAQPAAPVATAPTPTAPVSPPAANPATPARPPASTPPAATAPGGPVRWQWPTAGQVVGRFVAGDPTRQGISIIGSAGQPVNAAAAGTVVYSGSGLIGYGELVIVKHNDEFLSAYGHNRKRLVAEGEQVRAGQQIAEMGRSGAARDMLHFEIRRGGRPVDPSAHLPAR